MSDICPVTLYHGTSSFFLDSILENGLGGVNIIKEWGVLDLVNEMYPYAAERLSNHKSFGSFEKMAKQQSSPYGNYQHGGCIYVTPSLSTALRYTVKKKCGSELLHNAFLFYDELEKYRDIDCKKWKKKYFKVFNYKKFCGSPLIISFVGISYSDLLTEEEGKNVPLEMIQHVNCYKDNPDDILNGIVFRLTKVLGKESFKVFMPILTKFDETTPDAKLIELHLD